MKSNKLELIGYGMALLGFFLAFFIVSQTGLHLGTNPEASEKLNQELKDAVSHLEQKCGLRTTTSNKDEFVIDRVCNNSKSLRIELEHLRKKTEVAENEAEGQFWLSVLVLGVLFSVGFFGILKVLEWCLISRVYQPVVIKIPRNVLQGA